MPAHLFVAVLCMVVVSTGGAPQPHHDALTAAYDHVEELYRYALPHLSVTPSPSPSPSYEPTPTPFGYRPPVKRLAPVHTERCDSGGTLPAGGAYADRPAVADGLDLGYVHRYGRWTGPGAPTMKWERWQSKPFRMPFNNQNSIIPRHRSFSFSQESELRTVQDGPETQVLLTADVSTGGDQGGSWTYVSSRRGMKTAQVGVPVVFTKYVGAVHKYVAIMRLDTRWTGHPTTDAIARNPAEIWDCPQFFMYHCIEHIDPSKLIVPTPTPTPTPEPEPEPGPEPEPEPEPMQNATIQRPTAAAAPAPTPVSVIPPPPPPPANPPPPPEEEEEDAVVEPAVQAVPPPPMNQNTCVCEHGEPVPFGDQRCKVNGATVCHSCSENYYLDLELACVPNVCTCENGQAATAEDDCYANEFNVCVSCDDKHELTDDGTCEAVEPEPDEPPAVSEEAPAEPEPEPEPLPPKPPAVPAPPPPEPPKKVVGVCYELLPVGGLKREVKDMGTGLSSATSNTKEAWIKIDCPCTNRDRTKCNPP